MSPVCLHPEPEAEPKTSGRRWVGWQGPRGAEGGDWPPTDLRPWRVWKTSRLFLLPRPGPHTSCGGSWVESASRSASQPAAPHPWTCPPRMAQMPLTDRLFLVLCAPQNVTSQAWPHCVEHEFPRAERGPGGIGGCQELQAAGDCCSPPTILQPQSGLASCKYCGHLASLIRPPLRELASPGCA